MKMDGALGMLRPDNSISTENFYRGNRSRPMPQPVPVPVGGNSLSPDTLLSATVMKAQKLLLLTSRTCPPEFELAQIPCCC